MKFSGMDFRVRAACISMIVCGATLAPPAAASPAATSASESEIVGIVVSDGTETFTMTFDDPEPASSADELTDEAVATFDQGSAEADLSVTLVSEGDPVPQPSAGTPAASPTPVNTAALASARLSCGNTYTETQASGAQIRLSYRCDISPKRVAWDIKLGNACEHVVGNVQEHGLRWWRNGASQPQNAPHNEGCLYNWHGTMNPVPVGSSVDWQDHFTFYSNMGSGGNASLTFAQSFTTHQCEECP